MITIFIHSWIQFYEDLNNNNKLDDLPFSEIFNSDLFRNQVDFN